VLPSGFPRIDEVRLDWRVAAFACAAAIVVSLCCGMVPAFRRRDHVNDGLVDGAQATPATARTPAARVRAAFMASQVAVACVLLVGALLLTRSFAALLNADRGFDASGLLTARVPMPAKTTFGQRMAMLDRLQSRLRALPQVTDVAVGNALGFVTAGGFRGMNMPLPRDPSRTVDVQATTRAVSPEYFQAMRLRVRDGRPIVSTDVATSPGVVVVNRTFASQYLGDNPVGMHLTLKNWGEAGLGSGWRC
jgi:hypothetical protein